MAERSIEQQTLMWVNKLSNKEPFMAVDLYNLLVYLYLVHEVPLDGEETGLQLETADSEFFYRLNYYPEVTEDVGDEEDTEEQFGILYLRRKSIEKIEKEREDRSRRGESSLGDCTPFRDAEIEQLYIKRNPKRVSVWRYIEAGDLDSPMAGTELIYQASQLQLYDTHQNARSFGFGLAKNLWEASRSTLQQKNSINLEN